MQIPDTSLEADLLDQVPLVTAVNAMQTELSWHTLFYNIYLQGQPVHTPPGQDLGVHVK